MTPGSYLPSTSSSDAPPPVLTWLNFAAAPLTFFSRATVSPPPATEVDPKRSVFDFEQVEEVVRYQFKEGTWNLINNKFPHAVVGITEDRISLSIDFLSPTPPKFISDLMLSTA